MPKNGYFLPIVAGLGYAFLNAPIISLIVNASVLVQFVMGLLLLASFFSWYYIFLKRFALKRASRQLAITSVLFIAMLVAMGVLAQAHYWLTLLLAIPAAGLLVRLCRRAISHASTSAIGKPHRPRAQHVKCTRFGNQYLASQRRIVSRATLNFRQTSATV